MTKPAFIDLLSDESKDKEKLHLAEFSFATDGIVSDDHGNCYANEAIVSFGRKQNISVSRPKLAITNYNQRKYSIGSEWMYFKIYVGYKTSDYLLVNCLKPFVETLLLDEVINKWFFVRYNDPQYHIRLRLKLNDKDQFGRVFVLFNDSVSELCANNVISNIQMDTYDREIERYGDATIGLVEDLFCYQSQEAIAFMQIAVNSTDYEQLLLAFIIASIEQTMNHFGMTDVAKQKFLAQSLNGYKLEFRTNATTSQQLGK